MSLIKKYWPLLIALIAVIWYVILRYQNQKELEKYSITTVGKVDKLVRIRYVNSRFNYSYYHNGKKYTNESGIGDIDSKTIFNNFYKVIYSSKNPDISKIYLNEKIEDSLMIIQSGFKLRN